MSMRCRIDNTRRRRCDETLAQLLSQNEIGHVIERKRALKAVRRHCAARKYVPRIVDEHIDARLFRRNPGANLRGLGETRMSAM